MFEGCCEECAGGYHWTSLVAWVWSAPTVWGRPLCRAARACPLSHGGAGAAPCVAGPLLIARAPPLPLIERAALSCAGASQSAAWACTPPRGVLGGRTLFSSYD